ncbi:WD repeat-containing protein 89 [Chionoecetes opilio]|uniref:WD repeat-containing protein 89 n=1 Tax=Chionoecetes opilio TaxID=41210 RepID=A0A8J4YSA2_CHIOP|nr:WD repeat-containing protein 89 [Chionoecetes opilio]
MKMAATFPKEYKAVTSLRVAEDDYCLDLAHAEGWKALAVSASDKSVTLMETETLTKTLTLEPHKEVISGVKFSRTDSNILWTSSHDGTVKLWDLRTSHCEKELQGNTENSSILKPITCFDISNNERILCGGTELVEEGAFVLFWDIRGKEVLGSYFESVTDDITQVVFNPNQEDLLASASTDGVINIFDVSQNSEGDALTYSLNAEVVAGKLCWLSHGGKYERLAAATDVETLQYWDIRESAPRHSFSREEVASVIKCPEPDDSYIVSVMECGHGEDPLILAGFHADSESDSSDSSDCLRTLRLDLSSGS